MCRVSHGVSSDLTLVPTLIPGVLTTIASRHPLAVLQAAADVRAGQASVQP